MTMKKIYTLLIGSMGLVLAGCDEAPVPSIPQTNPQGPVLEALTASVTESSYLTSGDVITIQDLKDSNVESIPLLTVNVGASEFPEGSSLEAILELSANDDPFEKGYSVTIPISTSLTKAETLSGVANVALNDLETACETMFGLAPKTVTLYYQIPLSLVVDGTNYRLGGYDKYYAEGSIEIAYNPEVSIQEAYYLIGDVTNWADGGKDALNAYKFFNRSEDVYANPIFTLYLDVKANSYWKIIPQSTYDDFDNVWSGLIYGPSKDGSVDMTGDLTSTNAGAGCIVDAGRYVFTINMLEQTYEIKPVGDWMYYGIYMRGGENGWGYPAVDGFFSSATEGTLLDPAIYLPAGTEFKIADVNWNPINLGLASAGAITYGTPATLVNNGNNITASTAFTGYAVLVQGENDWALTLKPYATATAGASTGIYVKGDMNGWGNENSWEFKTTAYEGVYEIANVSIDANTGFKVADADWSKVNLGQGSEPMALDVAFPLYNDGNSGNINLSEPFSGTISLIYNSEFDQYFLYFLTEDALVTP